MPIPKRIEDHCFEPPLNPLEDNCAYQDCGNSELLHCWTVEAYRANPDFPSRDALIRLVHSLEVELEVEREREKGLREALESIARNTCCDKCHEAALVARAALRGG